MWEDAEKRPPLAARDPTTGCRTLITSRFAGWPAAAGIRAIQLSALEPEPARQFLLTRAGRTAEGPERAACDDLTRELGYLPLGLEQVAAYIAAPGVGEDLRATCGSTARRRQNCSRVRHWDRPNIRIILIGQRASG